MRALGTRTWNESLIKVGLLVRRPGVQQTTAVEPGLRIIRTLTKHLGRPPKIREYDEVAADRGVVRSQTLMVHIGRWWDVLEAAGGTRSEAARHPPQDVNGNATTPGDGLSACLPGVGPYVVCDKAGSSG